MIEYQYKCSICGNEFPVYQSLTDSKHKEYLCNECHAVTPVVRIITKSNFVLLGDNWSKDGYSRNVDYIGAQI